MTLTVICLAVLGLSMMDAITACSSQPGRDRIMPIPIPQGGGGYGGYGGYGGFGFGGMPFFGHFRKRRDSDSDAVEETVSEQDLDTEERQKRAVPFRRDNCPECLSICLMEVEETGGRKIDEETARRCATLCEQLKAFWWGSLKDARNGAQRLAQQSKPS